VRSVTPRVSRDMALGDAVRTLAEKLRALAVKQGKVLETDEKA
jgi:hypothetical protein